MIKNGDISGKVYMLHVKCYMKAMDSIEHRNQMVNSFEEVNVLEKMTTKSSLK